MKFKAYSPINKMPEFGQWDNPRYVLFRRFKFDSTPDIECLMQLVKEKLHERGNEGYLRSRLLGILWSQYSRANALFWTQRQHPYTWRIILFWRRCKEVYHRRFNTSYFRQQAMLSAIAKGVAREIKSKNNFENS